MMMMMNKRDALKGDIAAALNRHSCEGESGTPDYILAEYLIDCLEAYNKAVGTRASWYGLPIARPGAGGDAR